MKGSGVARHCGALVAVRGKEVRGSDGQKYTDANESVNDNHR